MTHDDDSLWERIKQTIIPLNRDDVLYPIKNSKIEKSFKSPKKINFLEELFLSPEKEVRQDPLTNIDRQTWRKIDKGQIKTQGKLDLHGMSLAQAHRTFINYIKTSIAQNKKCIIVVTGKGNREKGTGAIRRELPYWAQEPKIAPYIHSFSEPAKNPGRTVIILRRKKKVT